MKLPYEVTYHSETSYDFTIEVGQNKFSFEGVSHQDNEPDEYYIITAYGEKAQIEISTLDEMFFAIDGEFVSLKKIYKEMAFHASDTAMNFQLEDIAEDRNWNEHIRSYMGAN